MDSQNVLAGGANLVPRLKIVAQGARVENADRVETMGPDLHSSAQSQPFIEESEADKLR
jgi:hypothetical protein